MTTLFTNYAFATADAGTVGHERTLPDRISDVHNVMDFGATGAGYPTDDWNAIAAAYNSETVFRTTSSSNQTATFTGVVSTAKFTGTISGNNLTTSGPTGTIAIGQTISGSGVTSCTITNGSGSAWVVNGSSQTVGPVAMQTDSILVASSVTGTITVNDYLINNGGTDASPSTIYPGTNIVSNKGGGVYSLFLFGPATAAGFQEVLQQNFTSQAMMTVGRTLSLTAGITIVSNQGCYDVNNATAFGDGFSANTLVVDGGFSTTVTINGPVGGLVSSGHSIGFQFPQKGVMYFPPGNYYVSRPIDFTAGSPAVVWSGYGATLTGNFNNFVLQQAHANSQQTIIEGFNVVNSHATGGGIRLGGTNSGIIRDCTVTANRGISDFNSDAALAGTYYGSFEIAIESCTVNAGANYTGSIGIARTGDGPNTNCRIIGCEKGLIATAAQGAIAILGCYFEKCGNGIEFGRGPDGGLDAYGKVIIAGCWLKDNDVGIRITTSTGQVGLFGTRIEGTAGQAPGGDPQYGIVTGNTGGLQGSLYESLVAGVTVVGEFAVAGIYIAGQTSTNGFGVNMVAVSDSATSPHPFYLDTANGNIFIPMQIACSARNIYTVATIPTTSLNSGEVINVNDGTNTLGWGDPLANTGTHTTHYAAQWNGSSWTVVGK